MSVDRIQSALEGRITGTVRRNESMSRHTTFRVGGPAALFVEADTLSDLARVLETCIEHDFEWTVLGKGSNVLVADEGYPGLVLVLGREFKRHAVEGTRVETGAGVVLGHVVRDCYSRGLSGMEFAVGVPGTVGGALVMNAGSRNEWIGKVVESVTVFEPGTGLVALRGDSVAWGYRRTDLAGRGVVVESVLALEDDETARVRASMDASLRARKRSQPLSLPSAGSVFVNPEGDSAGRLIEASGLKGLREGGAGISTVHANFIVNHGGASAHDVLTLIRIAREAVMERNGIELTPEVRFIGPFERS